MKRLVVLISDVGSGTNLQAIISAVKTNKLNMNLVAVVCDSNKAKGLIHAKKNNIPVKISFKKENLLLILEKLKPDYLALAGWKQIISDEVLNVFQNKIINIHPGLIPEKLNGIVKAPDGSTALWNRGLLADKAISNFLEKKSTYAGSSVHFLTDEFDFGPVLERTFVKIKKNDTVASLYKRLKKKEHIIYIKALKKLEKTKKVLIIDGGGRGSALVEKYSASKYTHSVYALPGNDFILYQQGAKIFPNVKTTEIKKILKVVKENGIDIVDVAQDDAVAAGLTDAFTKTNVMVFGPTKKAGQIEWDKAWSREFMEKFNLPAPSYKAFNSQKRGIEYLKSQPDSKWFIKASGLAAGKGAIFANNNNEALDAIKEMSAFGNAGNTFLVEEFLDGEEFSAFAIANGSKFQLLGYAQDHKRLFVGDKGPNTGGMGCSSPPKIINKKVDLEVRKIFKKTLSGLASINRPYVGILYLGGIVTKNGKMKIIEFNARWGDPEAQVILPSIKNDYLELVLKTLKGNPPKIIKDSKYRVVVAATSKGYPADYSNVNGKEILNFSEVLNKFTTYGAGIKRIDDKWVANGGRIFYVLGEGTNVAQARNIAYNALSKIKIGHGELHFRKDIGYRDLNRIRHGSS